MCIEEIRSAKEKRVFIHKSWGGGWRSRGLLAFLAWGCFLFPPQPPNLTYHFLKAAAETPACLMVQVLGREY